MRIYYYLQYLLISEFLFEKSWAFRWGNKVSSLRVEPHRATTLRTDHLRVRAYVLRGTRRRTDGAGVGIILNIFIISLNKIGVSLFALVTPPVTCLKPLSTEQNCTSSTIGPYSKLELSIYRFAKYVFLLFYELEGLYWTLSIVGVGGTRATKPQLTPYISELLR
jgi:hypothetical protein